MPVKFKNLPGAPNIVPPDPGGSAKLRDALGLSSDYQVSVGATRSVIEKEGVQLVLPIGMAHIVNDATAYLRAVQSARKVFLASALGAGAQTASTAPSSASPDPYLSPDDVQWATATAETFFPGVLPLCKAKAMYQRVPGTSTNSVYRVCFIGPELRGACRFIPGKLSLRFQTVAGLCPSGEVMAVLSRLGVSSTDTDRATCHTYLTQDPEENDAEARAILGAFYAGLSPWLSSGFPVIKKLL